jgi:hypothetical protein
MGDHEKNFIIAKLTFPDEEVEKLPLPYVNALVVLSGVDDFFVTIGSVVPPEIQSDEDLEKHTELTAKPLFRFAVSRSNLESFIATLQERHDDQVQKCGND